MHYELKHLESANFKTKKVCAIVIDVQCVDFSITPFADHLGEKDIHFRKV